MSGDLQLKTAATDAATKNGGHAAAPRQGKSNMDTIVQARAPGNGTVPLSSGMSDHRKLAIWLDKLVDEAASKGKPLAQAIKLTPILAELFLERNPASRKVNLNTVDTFANDMAGGRWSINGEPIIVSDTGELNDGQHRCLAVKQSRATVDTVLVVGVSRESRITLDQGRARSVGDYLSMDGHFDARVLGAAAGYLWMYRNRGQLYTGGVTGGKFTATKAEIRQIVDDNPGLVRSVAIAGRQAQPIGGRPIIAFTHFILTGQDRAAGDEFVIALMEGANLKANNPILYARNRLIQERGRFRAPDKAELLFKAWNAWRTGTSFAHFRIQGGPLPVLEA